MSELLRARGPLGHLPDRGGAAARRTRRRPRVDRGEIVGVAGESGCGKSTLASTILRLQPASATVTGKVLVDGEDVRHDALGRPARAALGRRVDRLPGRAALAQRRPPDRRPDRGADPAARAGGRRRPRSTGGSASCSSRSGCRPHGRRPTRTSSPAASGSG